MVIRNTQLYEECYAAFEQKETISLSHLSFENGYYITEKGIILKVIVPNIYRLETDGWVRAQNYIDLWYDSMTDFSDIPIGISQRLKLDDYKIACDCTGDAV